MEKRRKTIRRRRLKAAQIMIDGKNFIRYPFIRLRDHTLNKLGFQPC
jgi:hypothetical protein